MQRRFYHLIDEAGGLIKDLRHGSKDFGRFDTDGIYRIFRHKRWDDRDAPGFDHGSRVHHCHWCQALASPYWRNMGRWESHGPRNRLLEYRG